MPLIWPYIVKMTWSHPKMPFSQRVCFLFSSLSLSKFGDKVSDLCHQCYHLADCSAAELKRGQTKSGAAGQTCCQILADFVQKELKRGRNIWKICFLLLGSSQ
jgi:hypothetical protein